MDFVIDQIETNPNIWNKPTKVSRTFQDLYKTIQNMRSDKDIWDKRNWQIRDIGNKETYQLQLQTIASIVSAQIKPGQAVTPQRVLEEINNNLEMFKTCDIVTMQEVNLMLQRIQENNKIVSFTIGNYYDIGLLDHKEYLEMQKMCAGCTKAMMCDTPAFDIRLENDKTKTVVRVTVFDRVTPLKQFRIGKYINDLLHKLNGVAYEIPEEIQFKDINSVIGMGIRIDLSYSDDFESQHYIMNYDEDGALQNIQRCKLE